MIGFRIFLADIGRVAVLTLSTSTPRLKNSLELNKTPSTRRTMSATSAAPVPAHSLLISVIVWFPGVLAPLSWARPKKQPATERRAAQSPKKSRGFEAPGNFPARSAPPHAPRRRETPSSTPCIPCPSPTRTVNLLRGLRSSGLCPDPGWPLACLLQMYEWRARREELRPPRQPLAQQFHFGQLNFVKSQY